MWIFIWLLLSVFVIGIFLWSIRILYEQKRAWRAFATKMKLDYKPGRLTEAPTITGMIRNHRVSFFSGAQKTTDMRSERFVTVIEIELGKGMPTGGAVATKDYEAFLQGLAMNETFMPDNPEWDPGYLIRARNGEALRAWLTLDRQQALKTVFNMKNAIVLFLFDELECVLRIETSDPLRKAEHMEKIMKKLLAIGARLSPEPQPAPPAEDQATSA